MPVITFTDEELQSVLVAVGRDAEQLSNLSSFDIRLDIQHEYDVLTSALNKLWEVIPE